MAPWAFRASGLTAPSLAIAGQTTSTIALAWTDPNASEVSYEIARAQDALGFVSVATTARNVTTWTDSALPTPTTVAITLSYKVRAHGKHGTVGAWSNTVTATLPVPPTPGGPVDALPHATPFPPPTLGARGTTVLDSVFNHRILRVTDQAADGTRSTHSYSSRSALNYDNTQVLIFTNGSGGWLTRAVTLGATLGIGSDWTVPTFFDPVIWDFSGSHNTRLYGSITGAGEADRYFWRADVGDSNVTVLTGSTFGATLRVAGTVTAATSSAVFTSTNIVSPITDLGTHFFVQQKVKFTSGALAGQEQIVSAFVSVTGQFTMETPFSGTPSPGDAFYVRPAGYNTQFDASPDGRYLAMGVAHQAGQGQDAAHIVAVYDTQSQAITRVRYLSKSDCGGLDPVGIHRLGMDRRPNSTKLWINLNGVANKFLLYDFGLDQVTFVNLQPSHEDASADSRLLFTNPAGGNNYISVDAATLPATTVRYQVPTKTYLAKTAGGEFTDNHVSWVDATVRPYTVAVSGSLSLSPVMTNTLWGADTTPIYRFDNWLSFYGENLHLASSGGVNDNLGEVWDDVARLIYKGSTKTAITGPGQWAYDPAASGGNGSLWVRTTHDLDLTAAGNSGVVGAFDWRTGQDEIAIVDISDPGQLQHYLSRIKTYNWATHAWSDPTVSESRGALSRDGKYVVFTSTWGVRPNVDVFIAETGL